MDAIVTMYYIKVQESKVISSGVISLVITFLQFTILYEMILSPDFLNYVIAYSLGSGIGVSMTVYYKKTKEQ
jgi:hypothetical protein